MIKEKSEEALQECLEDSNHFLPGDLVTFNSRALLGKVSSTGELLPGALDFDPCEGEIACVIFRGYRRNLYLARSHSFFILCIRNCVAWVWVSEVEKIETALKPSS